MLNKLFGKKRTPKKDTVIELNDGTRMDFDIYWLKRELEFQHQPDKLQFRTNGSHPLKFGELLNSLFDIRKEELYVLSINDGTLTTIEGEENIWNYEFLKHYNRNEKGEYNYMCAGCSGLMNQKVLTLSYRTHSKTDADKDKSISKKDAILIVHLQYPEGLKDKTLYIQTTFCLPTVMLERSKKGMNPQPKSFSILIGFDYRQKEEVDNEFFTVFKAAKEKLAKNTFGELDYLERELLDFIYHPHIAKEFYFGRKVMTENRYWDAIEYFNNAFKALQNQWWNEELTEKEFEMLIDCSFFIGYCYYELGLFDKSYKYLEFSANNVKEGYKYQSEYISCLIALKDVRSLSIINQHFKYLTGKKEEEWTPNDYEFYMFLLRRQAYCLIELKKYEEAEEILKDILEADPENEFAKQEIEYIKRIRNNK